MNTVELEEFFNTTGLPATVQLEQGVKITNVRAFVDSHLSVVKAHPNEPSTKPFYQRLNKLQKMLSGNE